MGVFAFSGFVRFLCFVRFSSFIFIFAFHNNTIAAMLVKTI